MPVRKRSNKRRAPLTGTSGMRFLIDDGAHVMFDWHFPNPKYTVFEARAIWEQVRTEIWRHDLRDLWPPGGALAYDGITKRTERACPSGPDFPIEKTRAAVEADLASVEAFRAAKPKAAAEIADELDAYAQDLRTLLALAEEGVKEEPNEFGYHESLRWAWIRFEMQRRDER